MFTIIIVLIVILLLAWVILEPPWAPSVPKTRATKAITQGAQTITNTSAGWWGSAVTLFRQRFPDTSGMRLNRFMVWLNDGGLAKAGQFTGKTLADDIKSLEAWLKAQPDGETAAFVDGAAALCKRYNLNLEWMWDERSTGDLKQAVSETFTLYALSVWKAYSAHALSLFKTWQAAPWERKYRTYAQLLYTRLVDKGLVKPSAQMLLAPEKERQEHVVATINAAVAENPAEFSGILQSVADEMQKLQAAAAEAKAARKVQPAAASGEPAKSAASVQ